MDGAINPADAAAFDDPAKFYSQHQQHHHQQPAHFYAHFDQVSAPPASAPRGFTSLAVPPSDLLVSPAEKSQQQQQQQQPPRSSEHVQFHDVHSLEPVFPSRSSIHDASPATAHVRTPVSIGHEGPWQHTQPLASVPPGPVISHFPPSQMMYPNGAFLQTAGGVGQVRDSAGPLSAQIPSPLDPRKPEVMTPPLSDVAKNPSPRPHTHFPIPDPSLSTLQAFQNFQYAGFSLDPLPDDSKDVRKKNAKIDIPAGITLQNIDEKLKAAMHNKDPEQIASLKQQKRLLRNREAALHSRQKKKQRAEELEQQVGKLDSEKAQQIRSMNAMHEHIRTLTKAKEDLEAQVQQLQNHNQRLERNLRGLTSQHSQEKANWELQVANLQTNLQHSQAPSTSTVPETLDYSAATIPTQSPAQQWDSGPNDTFSLGQFINPSDLSAFELDTNATQRTRQTPTVSTDIIATLLLLGSFWVLHWTSNPTRLRVPRNVHTGAGTVLEALFREASVIPSGIVAQQLEKSPARFAVDGRVKNILASVSTADAVHRFQEVVDNTNRSDFQSTQQ